VIWGQIGASPDIKAIKTRLDALVGTIHHLEGTVNRNHGEVMSAINRTTDYNQVLQRGRARS
jgi:hypothetical protein